MYVVDDDTQLALKEVDLMVSQAQSELVRHQLLQVRRALRTQIKPNFAAVQELAAMQKADELKKKIPIAGAVAVISTAAGSAAVFLLMDIFRCQEKAKKFLASGDIGLDNGTCEPHSLPSTFSSQTVGAVAIVMCCLGESTFFFRIRCNFHTIDCILSLSL